MSVAHACTSCGLIQSLPDNTSGRGGKARCARCDYTLRPRAAAGPWEAMFWVFVLLGLLVLLVQDTFMSFTFAGGTNHTAVTTGPLEVVRLGSTFVGVAVLFCALVSPALWGLGMLYVLAGLASRMRGPGTAAVLRVMQALRPYVMLEVFVLGILVTHGKLAHDGAVGFGRGFYLYLAALGVWIVIARRVKFEHLWECLQPAGTAPSRCGVVDDTAEPPAPCEAEQLLGCETCGLVQRVPRVTTSCAFACTRCHAALHECPHAARRRSVVLLVLAMLMLVPANFVPIMRIAKLGPPEPATVWEGIKVLYFDGSPGLAALVLVASLVVPILKVVVIAGLVVWRRPRRAATARGMTKVHRFVATIGRWSMVDMFVVALLIGLVQLGSLASVDPKPGAIAFLAVVLLTIVAAEELKPKLFWSRVETPRV